jgi:hypothetical protein
LEDDGEITDLKSEEDGKSDIRGFSLTDLFIEGSLFLGPLSMSEHGMD